MGHDIIPTYSGWPTFGWLMATFVVATVLFALSLATVIRTLRHIKSESKTEIRERMKKSPKLQNFWERLRSGPGAMKKGSRPAVTPREPQREKSTATGQGWGQNFLVWRRIGKNGEHGENGAADLERQV